MTASCLVSHQAADRLARWRSCTGPACARVLWTGTPTVTAPRGHRVGRAVAGPARLVPGDRASSRVLSLPPDCRTAWGRPVRVGDADGPGSTLDLLSTSSCHGRLGRQLRRFRAGLFLRITGRSARRVSAGRPTPRQATMMCHAREKPIWACAAERSPSLAARGRTSPGHQGRRPCMCRPRGHHSRAWRIMTRDSVGPSPGRVTHVHDS